jgi:flavin reductase (DIM6/NTAB) family NADH-FMN oxidoreductase RutF
VLADDKLTSRSIMSGGKQSNLDTGARELRNAFGSYPTGVTVVTCMRRNGTMVGVTVNSFVSLSISPPLVSIAFHSAARHLSAFLECGSFAINVLRSDQDELSTLFTRPSECSWRDVPCRTTSSGHLVLDGAAASFSCRLFTQHEIGDHLLLVGEVEHFAYDARAEPMAFLRGRYGSFQIAAHTQPVDSFEASSMSAIGWG